MNLVSVNPLQELIVYLKSHGLSLECVARNDC